MGVRNRPHEVRRGGQKLEFLSDRDIMQEINFVQNRYSGQDGALEEECFLLPSSCKDNILSRAVLPTHDDSLRATRRTRRSILGRLAGCGGRGEAFDWGMPDKWGGESPREVMGSGTIWATSNDVAVCHNQYLDLISG